MNEVDIYFLVGTSNNGRGLVEGGRENTHDATIIRIL